MAGITYSIRKNRFKEGSLRGLTIEEDGSLLLAEDTSIHMLFLKGLDSAIPGATWSRLSFSLDVPDNVTTYTYLFASDEEYWYENNEAHSFDEYLTGEADVREKKLFLEKFKAKRTVNKTDILLYELQGRYLYIAMELSGTAAGILKDMRVERGADIFHEAFPEVYRENNSVFHRFISVYNSLYNDFDKDITRLPDILDPDTCPKECLGIFLSWMGIELDGDFLKEGVLRTLAKEAYHLNRLKGTKTCLERLIQILLGERPLILEQNMIKAYEEKGEILGEAFQKGSIYDVNILIRKKLSERERFQLLFLIDQFKPIRARIHIIQLREGGVLDSNVYLDMNARVEGTVDAVLDDSLSLTENVVLT